MRDLEKMLEHLEVQDDIWAVRNIALITVGFFGALRRSELVALNWEDIQFGEGGVIITIHQSKTNRTGQGDSVTIRVSKKGRCPVQALLKWRQISGCSTGPVFRGIFRTGKVLDKAINPEYFNTLLKEVAHGAGLNNWQDISGHSLRRGFATESARRNVPLQDIKKHGRWRSTKTVLEYIEVGRQFQDAVGNYFIVD